MAQARKEGMLREIDSGARRGCALYSGAGRELVLIVTVNVVRI
jgi:hypothetical protein